MATTTIADITKDQARAAGGSLWEKNGLSRVYLNAEDWMGLVKLEVGRYKSGNISWATFRGDPISNAEAYRLMSLSVYVDDRGLHVRSGQGSAKVYPVTRNWIAEVIARHLRSLPATRP